MAFWGVEVKPGKPFTHEYDDSKGRLHISMATLGFGSSTGRSTLQCNVGNMSPLYLCSLYPGTTECLQLNLEFEEIEKVIFSVIGPRSFHLSGYYIGRSNSRNANISDHSESYGEDIANTETDRSSVFSDEDKYGGSFIDDDGDLKFFPPSPISDDEEAFHNNRTKGRKSSLRRLRRKYQSVESDDNEDFEEKILVDDNMDDQTKETENEDNLPISLIVKNKASRRILDDQMNDSGDQGAGGASIKNYEYGGSNIIETDLTATNVLIDSQTHRDAALAGCIVDPCTVLNVEGIKTSKRKKGKGEGKEIKSSFNVHSMKLENTVQDDPKMDKTTSNLLAGNEQSQKHVDDKETETMVKILPSFEVGHGEVEKPKKKRKARCNGASDGNLVDLSQRREHNIQPAVNDAHGFPGGNQNEGKIKRRKKRSKSQENIEVNSELRLSAEQKSDMEMKDAIKRANEKHLQVRTLSNGLVIQELQMGKKDGKIAASGKKISIYYTGKLKENGEVFESSSSQAPFKFRLGKGEVIEGWDIGLEGMRVGEKRRLVIPPSMTFQNEEYSEKVPPNSWLVYDFELVKVH